MIWEKLSTILQNKGFKVFAPGVHIGDVKDPYVVVKDDIAVDIPETTSKQHDYAIYIYYPIGNYNEFLKMIEDIKTVLVEQQEIYLKLESNELPSLVEDETNAYVKQININIFKRKREVL